MKRILQIRRQYLDCQPALREENQLQVVPEEFERDPARFGEIRAAYAELCVHDRRVHEQKELLAARRAIFFDQLEPTAGESFGQLARIGNRRRRTDENRIRPVMPADALQAAEDVPKMAPEDAAISVKLIDHDEP